LAFSTIFWLFLNTSRRDNFVNIKKHTEQKKRSWYRIYNEKEERRLESKSKRTAVEATPILKKAVFQTKTNPKKSGKIINNKRLEIILKF
jgi:hypothetical protein